ncbi:hypothetical protein MKY08_19400 [Lysinibacillus sp. FSL M8-0337]|uniref:Uncharacterized protein n=1 Tax=Lysinibacillus sphaericus TaxID=1421 RepID=A0A2S5CUI8_LYSSH|nr:hypothetical protein [Lysinibacillus sphaericus]POZ54428.1 hypothetical protein LYSIN_04097 [Lysinibacillus sphaericus]
MEQIEIFYAPFIVVIISILIMFWWAPKDDYVRKNKKGSRE